MKTKVKIKVLAVLIVYALTVSLSEAKATSSVDWFAEDTITGGDWYYNPIGSPIGVYGSYAHILPNAPVTRVQIPIDEFSIPIGFDLGDNGTWYLLGGSPYNWHSNQIIGLPFYANYTDRCLNPPYWDEYVSLSPKVTYHVSGTYMEGTGVQYPAFEFAFEDWHATQTEPREVYYTTHIDMVGGPGWRLASWDDGGERCQPEHGYIDFTLTFPEGTYLLSLYAYDYITTARESQEYRIYDETGTTLLASKGISGIVFDDGVYEIFKVVAPSGGLTIIVQVYNDAGHVVTTSPSSPSSPVVPNYPPGKSNNVVLSGIFVDRLEPEVVGGEVSPFNPLMLPTPWIALTLIAILVAALKLLARTSPQSRMMLKK